MKSVLLICVIFAIVAVATCDRDPRCPVETEGSLATHIPHETECNLFYKCDPFGELLLNECWPGLHFNPATGVCDYPYNVNCKL